VAKRVHVIDTLKTLIQEGTEIDTWGDRFGFIAVTPENQEKFNRIDAFRPNVRRFLEQYGDDESIQTFEKQGRIALEIFLRQVLEDHTASSITSLVPSEANRQRQPLLQELETEYELKKLQPNFIELTSEYVEAHNDDSGVIVRGASKNGETFHVLTQPYGNEHPRNRVKSVRKVSFRAFFVCFDRETKNHPHRVDIHRGAWLTEADTEMDFPDGCAPRRAVIVTVEGTGDRVYAVRRDSDSTYKGILPLREELTGSVYDVNLCLLVESKNSAAFRYILQISRDPAFKVSLTNARLWKSTHLHKFISEGLIFTGQLHDIWQDAQNQVPIPKVDTTLPFSLFTAFRPGSEAAKFDYDGALARIRDIEREQESKLLDEIKDWENRSADFLDDYIGREQRDKFINALPSLDDGFNRVKKPSVRRLILRPPSGSKDYKPPPPELPYWDLTTRYTHERAF